MEKRLFPFALVMLLLASCSSGASSSSSTSGSSSAPVQSSAEASKGSSQTTTSSEQTSQSGNKYLFYDIKPGQTKEGLDGSPWLNPSPAGTVAKIEKPSLKDDFFIATNYDYLSTKTLQPTEYFDGGTIAAMGQVQKNYMALGSGEANKGSYAAPIKKAFELHAASDKSKDIAAVKEVIAQINAISNKQQLFAFLNTKKAGTLPWGLFTLLHVEDGVRIYDERLGLSMPGLVDSCRYEGSAQENIVEKFSKVLEIYGYEETEAKRILNSGFAKDIELREGQQSASSEGCAVSALNEDFPNLQIQTLFKGLGYRDQDKVYMSDETYRMLLNIDNCSDEDVAKIKDDLLVRVMLGAKTVLSDEMYIELAMEFDSNSKGYPPEMLIRERFVDAIRQVYDRAYLDNFETAERKRLLLDLMKQTKDEYHGVIDAATWLSSTTKAKAKEKLDAMKFDACFPDHLLSIPSFSTGEADNFYSVLEAYREWLYSANQPAFSNPNLWITSITFLNAVYYPDSNSFIVYDGILAVNPYGANEVEELYGSIGSVIGHEISHSFDSMGAKYDAHGIPKDWWTPTDYQAFQAKGQKIIDSWNTISYKQGVDMWGAKMLNEIIADMGGISVMLRLAEKKANFDYVKFFNAYSASYASVFNEAFLEQMFYQGQDEHPMNYLRVNNVLNQYPKFYETFGISTTDKMFVSEENRLPIW